MKGKLAQNLSANSLQLVVNQFFGFVIFFVLSTGLDKQLFGQLNLTLAILLTAFNILSCGIDQVVVRKIAIGEEPKLLLSLHLFHVILSGMIFYAILLALNYFEPSLFGSSKLLLLIGIGKLLMFVSTPLKQVAAGFEKFRLLSWMSVTSNIIRGCVLVILALLHLLNVGYVVILFIAADAAELLFTIILFKVNLNISLSSDWRFSKYWQLVKESVPQIGVVIFTSALARFDWIFIGFMVSAVKLAEYSFAYKIFEIATLPLLALAPLLVPYFSRVFKNNHPSTHSMHLLIRMEMVVSVFISMVLFLVWSPLVDWLTSGKYGAVNAKTILILALCMPLLYLNNFFWSISFAKGRLKMIFGIIAVTLVVNVLGDILLIPIFKNEGAALAYLLAMLVQCILYLKKNNITGLSNSWKSLLMCIACALPGAFIGILLFANVWIITLVATASYIGLLFIFRQLRFRDYKSITRLLN